MRPSEDDLIFWQGFVDNYRTLSPDLKLNIQKVRELLDD
jgi:hypothetical protein